jgi:hypothetical protein
VLITQNCYFGNDLPLLPSLFTSSCPSISLINNDVHDQNMPSRRTVQSDSYLPLYADDSEDSGGDSEGMSRNRCYRVVQSISLVSALVGSGCDDLKEYVRVVRDGVKAGAEGMLQISECSSR